MTPPPHPSSPPHAPQEGIPLGVVSSAPFARGSLMIAPSWLASLGIDPEPPWAASNPPGIAYLHLTNMWHCFPHPCWSKAGRLFWLRAHGFWDARLDQLGLTPRGKPFDTSTRVLMMPQDAFSRAVTSLTPPVNPARQGKKKEHASAPARSYAYRRFHALIHNLVAISALLGRRPLIPDVPCEFIRAVQPLKADVGRARFGVVHASVVATGTAAQPTCHLAPGTWRPGSPDQCYHNWVMHPFDFSKFIASAPVVAAANGSSGALRLNEGSIERLGASDARDGADAAARSHIAFLKGLCQQAAKEPERPVAVLEGVWTSASLREGLLVDAVLPQGEMRTEAMLRESRKGRWRSVLQKKTLEELSPYCPGAKTLVGFRKTCTGYFMAE